MFFIASSRFLRSLTLSMCALGLGLGGVAVWRWRTVVAAAVCAIGIALFQAAAESVVVVVVVRRGNVDAVDDHADNLRADFVQELGAAHDGAASGQSAFAY